MSHSKVETSRKRRVFSEEFKQDAVRLVVSENYTFVATALGWWLDRSWVAADRDGTETLAKYFDSLGYKTHWDKESVGLTPQ